MALGTRALVMKGKAQNDLGQMAVASPWTRSQVEILYLLPVGIWKTRRKQPASLLWMEEGIEVTIDDNGWLVIRKMREQVIKRARSKASWW